MRKTLVYIAILGILGYGVWFFLFNEKDVFNSNEAGFTVKDTSAINRIFLADNNGEGVSLQRTDSGWIVNDNYKAIPARVNLLLETIHEQMPMYPVPESAHNNVVKMMAGTATKVELYDRNGGTMRVFYVGGQANNNTGTYMLMEGAKRPYVVQMPVFQGYVAPRYSVQLKEWRDRTVTDIPADELKKVALNNVNEPLNSFTMSRKDDGSWAVEIHPELMKGKELNVPRVKAYAGFFTSLYCEGYLNGVTDLDSIIASTEKVYDIDVAGKSGQHQHIDIYWMPVTKRSKNLTVDNPDVPDEYDPDRFYAVINNSRDTVIIQRLTFEKIFRRGYEFYQKTDQ